MAKTKQPNTNEATPRPWKVIGKADLMIKGHVCGTGDDQDGNSYFVQGDDYPEGTQTAKADAELIVRAVNAYEPMLAALRAVEWTHGLYRDTCPSCLLLRKHGHKLDCQLAAAIALADPMTAERNTLEALGEESNITRIIRRRRAIGGDKVLVQFNADPMTPEDQAISDDLADALS